MSNSAEVQNVGTSKFVCPKCGSSDIKNCAIIHTSGTTSLDLGVEGANFNFSHGSQLAKELAPPQKKETHPIAMVVFGLITILCLYGGAIIGAVIFGILTYANYSANQDANRYNENEYPAEYEAWQDSYICFKCGHKFVIR